MNYLWHVLVIVNLYVMLAASLNLVVGYAGLLSLCHAAFYGIGAYTATLLMTRAGLGFFAAVSIAIPVTAALSFLISIPALRLKGDYFVLATLGFQIIVFSTLYNWVALTQGPFGITGIPAPRVFGYAIETVFSYFLFTGVLAATVLGLLWLLIRSPFGRLLRAVREDEVAAEALGKNVPRVKTSVFAIGAALAAVPGAALAGYTRYIDPSTFTLLEAIFVLSIVVIGGAGSFTGPIVGAAVLVALPEILRLLQFPEGVAASLRQVLYGMLLVVLMRYRPRGFRGEYEFR